MRGLTEIFAMLSTAILLRVIDYRRYGNPAIALSEREEKEITSAQTEAKSLVRFLTDKINLVDETGKNISVEEAFVSYLMLQARWLRWKSSEIMRQNMCNRLLTANFLQNDNARKVFQEEEMWNEWGGVSPQDCFLDVDRLLCIGFEFPKGPLKRELVGNGPTHQPSKRQRM
jgi:hypothetical protein